MHNKPLDHSVRQAALNTAESFAVSAPAGSGKTGLLTLRVLNLLSTCTQPEEILCITFTRKASQEMRERIIGALTQAQSLSDAEIAQIENPHKLQLLSLAKLAANNNIARNWQLDKMPFRLKILTIDSFCRSLTQQMPLMSKMGASPNITDDATSIFELAVRSLINNCNTNGWPEALQTLFNHLDGDLNRLARLLVSLLHTRDQWLPLIYQSTEQSNSDSIRYQLENNLAEWAMEIISDLSCELQPYESDLCALLDFAGSNMREDSPSSIVTKLQGVIEFPDVENPQYALDNFWQPFAKIALGSSTDAFLKKVDKRHGFPTRKDESKALFAERKAHYMSMLQEFSENDTLRNNLLIAANFPQLQYSESQWQVLASLTKLLPLLVAHLKLSFQQTNSVDFVEIAESARTALGNFSSVTELALKLDYQLKHILVDEFQDTSHAQLSLLQLLTREWQEDADKTLFVVGDGMQSCYGFRNANVGIFLDVRKNGLAGKDCNSVDLNVNFRSTDTIIDWVNRHFERAFPEQDNITLGAVSYTPSFGFSNTEDKALQTTLAQSFVRCEAYLDQQDRKAEANAIAEKISTLKQQWPDESIAILVRGRSHLSEILPALQQYNLDYSAVDIDPLLSRQHIQDLLAITSVLEDPSDEASWLTLFRSPWCGLDNFDLHALFNPDIEPTQALSLYEKINIALASNNLSKDGTRCLARLFTPIQSTLKQIDRKPLKQLVESLWLKLGGPEILSEKNHQQDIDTFLILLNQHATHGRLENRSIFIRALEKLYAQPLASENAIQILTMHKSKGLEFDSVFLPSLDKQGKADTAELLYWHERLNSTGNIDLFLSPIASSNSENNDGLTTLLSSEAKRRKTLEECRLLYVACTRAKKRLYLSANLNSNDEGEPKPPSKSSMLSKLWSSAEEEFEFIISPDGDTANDEVLKTEPALAQSQLVRLPLDFNSTVMTSERRQNWRPDAFDNSELTIFPRTTTDNLSATALGTVLHRILCRIHADGFSHWNKHKIDNARPFWVAQLMQLGLTSSDAATSVGIIRETVEQLLTDKTAAWVLGNHHQDSQSEYRLHYGVPVKLAILDRTFVDDHGTRWIIDYKSSIPNENESIDDFMTRELASYRSQLKFYADLMQQLDASSKQLSIVEYRSALYFPRLLRLAEYPPCK